MVAVCDFCGLFCVIECYQRQKFDLEFGAGGYFFQFSVDSLFFFFDVILCVEPAPWSPACLIAFLVEAAGKYGLDLQG